MKTWMYRAAGNREVLMLLLITVLLLSGVLFECKPLPEGSGGGW